MEPFQTESGPDKMRIFTVILGLVLLVLGVIVALNILVVVFKMINDTSQVALVDQLAFKLQYGKTIRTHAGDIELPTGFFLYGAYILAILLLGVAGGITRAFLTLGVRLLLGNDKKVTESFRAELRAAVKQREITRNAQPPHGES